eukprot:m.170972 g.170972  ORF g.170972 m.170972 type:complete len:849 (-) comp13315_c0_seq1:181-2727(-)
MRPVLGAATCVVEATRDPTSARAGMPQAARCRHTLRYAHPYRKDQASHWRCATSVMCCVLVCVLTIGDLMCPVGATNMGRGNDAQGGHASEAVDVPVPTSSSSYTVGGEGILTPAPTSPGPTFPYITFPPPTAPTPAHVDPMPNLPIPGFPLWRFRALYNMLNKTFANHTHPPHQDSDVLNCAVSLANSLTSLFTKGSGAAFQMFDSWGVFPGDPGSFTECVNAPGDTHYCSVAVQTDENYITPGMGICAPRECNETTLNLMRNLLVASPEQGVVTTVTCFETPQWSEYLGIVLALCAVLLMLIIFATAVDAFMVIGLFAAADEQKEKEAAVSSPLFTAVNDDGEVQGDDDVWLLAARRNNSRRRRRDSAHTRKIWMRYPDGRTAGVCWLAIDVFSLPRSLMALFAAPTYSQELRVFDGLKVLSMLWVMSGQTMSLIWPLITNKASIYVMGGWEKPWVQVVLQSSMATDTFLFISAFLAMHRTLEVFSRRVAPKGVFGCTWLVLRLMIRRYLRLAPLLAVSMAAYLWVLPAWMDGPYWSNFFVQPDYKACDEGWWRVLTFSNNLGMPDSDASTGCMSWTWYLALDMQLAILCPILALLFWRYGVVALVLNFMLLIGSSVAVAWVIHAEGLEACSASLQSTVKPHLGLLVKPWTRAPPYILGILLAYWVNAMGGEEGIANISKPSLIRRLAIGAVSFGLMSGSLFGGIGMQFDNDNGAGLTFGPDAVLGNCQWTRNQGQVYLALYRLLWSFGILILALICLAGWGGWATSILSMQSWTTYSRLVYGAYLVHPILCQAFAYGAQRAMLYSDWNFLNWYAGLASLSFVFSAISYVLLEGPLIRIVKGYIPR